MAEVCTFNRPVFAREKRRSKLFYLSSEKLARCPAQALDALSWLSVSLLSKI